MVECRSINTTNEHSRHPIFSIFWPKILYLSYILILFWKCPLIPCFLQSRQSLGLCWGKIYQVYNFYFIHKLAFNQITITHLLNMFMVSCVVNQIPILLILILLNIYTIQIYCSSIEYTTIYIVVCTFFHQIIMFQETTFS